MSMTYAQATYHHMDNLAKHEDWEAHYYSPKRYSPKPLTTPYAERYNSLKIYFKPQATWYGHDRPVYSLHIDRRDVSTEELLDWLDKYIA